ncbi:unnamed protein product, partial [marine sediment metagenome]
MKKEIKNLLIIFLLLVMGIISVFKRGITSGFISYPDSPDFLL